MGYYCTVPQCTSLAGKTKNVKFHRFPRDETMADKWNVILKRGKPYTKYSKVCSLHFTQSDYNITTMGQWKTLSKDAIPTQNLPKLNPDGSVMVIRKSRSPKYKTEHDVKKEECRYDDSFSENLWTNIVPNHSSPDQHPMKLNCNDSKLQVQRELNSISTVPCSGPSPTSSQEQELLLASGKVTKQDAFMQTDPPKTASTVKLEIEIPDTKPSENDIIRQQYKPSLINYNDNKDNNAMYNNEYNDNTADGQQNSILGQQNLISEQQSLLGQALLSGQQGLNGGLIMNSNGLNDGRNFYRDSIKKESEEDSFLASYESSPLNGNDGDSNSAFLQHNGSGQVEANMLFPHEQRSELLSQQQRLLEQLQQQQVIKETDFYNHSGSKTVNIKHEPDLLHAGQEAQVQATMLASNRDNDMPTYYGNQSLQNGGMGAYLESSVHVQPQQQLLHQQPGPELLIAKQNALAAHTGLWQNTMKRPFFYSEAQQFNTAQLFQSRYEDLTRLLNQ